MASVMDLHRPSKHSLNQSAIRENSLVDRSTLLVQIKVKQKTLVIALSCAISNLPCEFFLT